MKTYWVKIAMHGVSPMVWRRLCIPADTSLAQLHQVIQILFNWDDDHLHQFHIYGKDYGISYIGGIGFSDNPYQTFIDNFDFDIGDKFTYEYNFFEHNLVDIRIENIKDTPQASVFCTKGNGMVGVNKYDKVEPTLNLLKAIVNADEHTTMRDIRPFVDELNAVRFNRHHINHQLHTELNIET